MAGWYYCVIRCGTYAILYHGQDRTLAEAVLTDDAYLGEGPTFGEAQVRAALGAGKKTQSRRSESERSTRRPAS